jgi:thiamine-monophosphate kinase
MARCRAGTALRRSGAQDGDLVIVSGDLGGAALALQLAELDQPPPFAELSSLEPSDALYALRRYFLPTAQLALGVALRGLASAAIDLSDGLLADLGHVCRASRVGARLELSQLPVVAGAGLPQALSGGDDYELCFTAPPQARQAVLDAGARLNLPLSEIGVIERGAELVLLEQGQLYAEPYALTPAADPGGRGFQHF